MRVLRENRTDARVRGICCHVEEFVKVWEPKDRSGRQGDFELLEGAFGGWIPVELGLPQHVSQRSGEGTKVADEESIKLS